ncbi:CaiB/BaiF CoA transferase family protein [Nakamurella leprariae]|uniref:CoA transferase n=1 Tax=Nakamurella leprariae TaxID=2803911 RepID=A0A938YJ13_9ACTN|nr:CoA transferase [Nakamurella leprariae]MBM9468753.1 CoA transferase [Nakamurella leprariae]
MSTDSPSPLHGIRVIELGQLIAGPFCGQLLADFGADVIKVEEPDRGDPMRSWGVVRDGRSLSWNVIARGKRCVTADLRTAEGRDFILELAAQADVVVENFRPGTMEKFGLSYDDLAAVNAGIVLTRVSGFGQYGPYAPRAGYGSIGEAMGGLRYLIGDPDRPPSRFGVSLGDLLAGMHAALGTLLALRSRDRTGTGQVVDVSIYESVLAMTESLVSDFAVAGVTRRRSGAILPGVAPSNVYGTADDQLLLIAANQDTVFRRLAAAMGRPELATDPRFATHGARGEHQTELDDLVDTWTSGLSAADLAVLLDEHAVPFGAIYRAADMLTDPQFRARQSIVEVPDPQLGPVPMQGIAPQLSGTPGRIRWGGPAHGEHDREVRAWLAGFRAAIAGSEPA